MSTPEENKAVIRKYYAEVSAGRFQEAQQLLTPDARFAVQGKNFDAKGATIAERIEAYQKIKAVIDGNFMWTIVGMLAEGDSVATELVSNVHYKDGRTYSNRYHMLTTFRDGKIVSNREYMDTKYAEDFHAGFKEAFAGAHR